MPEIFISYRRSDSAGHTRALHRDLCRRFRDENIFYDRSSIESGDIFPEELKKGVSECKVLLALIGPDWLEVKNKSGERRLEDPNDFVRQEIARALESGKKVIPVLFDDTPMMSSDRLPEPIKTLAHCDALTLRGKTYEYDIQLDELIRLLSKVPGIPKPRPAEKGGGDKFVRFAEDLLSDHFTGRTEELNSLAEALPMGDSSLRTTPVVLYGMGGGGKTQIALKWIDGHQDDYTGIWWFRSERSEILDADLEEFCLQCNVPRSQNERPLSAFVRWLARQPRWLLVFDNVDDKEQLRPYIKPFREQKNLGRHHLLITSRNPDWTGIAKAIKVSPWEGEEGHKEALEFLQLRLPEADENKLTELAEQLGGLPLALEQAASFIDETGLPVFEYLDLLASVDTAGILLEEGRPATGYECNVVAALSLSIERLSQAALQLFRIFACMSPDPIPLDPLRRHFESFPAELGEAARQPIAWHKMVGELVRYSLAQRLQVVSREKNIGDGLQFHRLTQQVALVKFVEPSDRKAALELIAAALPEKLDDHMMWPTGLSLLPHLQSLTLLCRDEMLYAELIVDTLNRGTVLASHAGLPGQGEILARNAHQIGFELLGEEHPNTTISAFNLFITLRKFHKIEETKRIFYSHLSWLMDAESQSLSHDQILIREKLKSIMDNKNVADYSQ